jgi:hypothetical protein
MKKTKQNKNGESVVLNICERIGVRFLVDLSILVKSWIVACIAAGESRACHNLIIEIHGSLSTGNNIFNVNI